LFIFFPAFFFKTFRLFIAADLQIAIMAIVRAAKIEHDFYPDSYSQPSSVAIQTASLNAQRAPVFLQ
jgi:hypothetical protein